MTTRLSEPWYLAERAEQLALVRLTRFGHVTVSHSPDDQGLDLLATVGKPGRVFGVVVKAATAVRDLIAPDGAVRNSLTTELNEPLSDYPFPVALMLFDMRSDEGWFCWLLAPVVDAQTTRLQRADGPNAVPATDEVVRSALAAVEAWYDARRNRHG